MIDINIFDYNFNLRKDEEQLFKYAVQYTKTLSVKMYTKAKYNTKMISPIYFPLYLRENIDDSKFKTTDEGLFSVTTPFEANIFSLIIIRLIVQKAKIIMDFFANCGGNTISYCLFF